MLQRLLRRVLRHLARRHRRRPLRREHGVDLGDASRGIAFYGNMCVPHGLDPPTTPDLPARLLPVGHALTCGLSDRDRDGAVAAIRASQAAQREESVRRFSEREGRDVALEETGEAAA